MLPDSHPRQATTIKSYQLLQHDTDIGVWASIASEDCQNGLYNVTVRQAYYVLPVTRLRQPPSKFPAIHASLVEPLIHG
jgi:hypothetical protein